MTHDHVLDQLRQLKLTFNFFGKAEVRELSKILSTKEQIRHCSFGFYQGGSALLVATDMRLLLIDKRPFFLNLEDIRYEMINEVDFAGRLLDATVSLHTGNKRLAFRSFSDARLRQLCRYVQEQITHARQLEYVVERMRPTDNDWQPRTLLLTRPRVQKYSTPLQ